MRATIQSDMFMYDQPGQNLDIRGVIRYRFPIPFPKQAFADHVVCRYSDGAKTGLPGDPISADPGPGISGLNDTDGMTILESLIAEPAPNATRAVQVSFSFQRTPDGRFRGFGLMNSTSWKMLHGTTTLMEVHKDPTGYVPEGVGIGLGGQLLVTEETIQVLDVRIVR